MLNLTSVEAKLGRAKAHAQSLQDEIAKWREAGGYRIDIEPDADRRNYSLIGRLTAAPDLEHWSLITADCLHNLRTALDQLVFAIAEIQVTPWPMPDQEIKRLSFILIDDPKNWDSTVYKIGRLSQPVQDAIKSVQPYSRGHVELPPPLSVLRDFDDFDKHRLLRLALFQPHYVEFRHVWNFDADNPYTLHAYDTALVDGAVLARISFERPEPDLHVDFFADVAVAMNHAAGPKGHTASGVRDLIKLLSDEVAEVIGIVKAAVV